MKTVGYESHSHLFLFTEILILKKSLAVTIKKCEIV